MKLETLVVTVDEENEEELIKKLNIQGNAVIANQCGKTNIQRLNSNNSSIVIIESETRGVGINRNIALQYANADIVLFSDDDIVYADGYVDKILDAFKKQQDADAIIFSFEITKNGNVVSDQREKDERLKFTNALKYGAVALAVRQSFIKKHNIHFSEIFGGGCMFSCGEDSLFIKDLFKKGARIYTNSYILGKCSYDSSTWFTGYNEKFFYDKGVFIACAFSKWVQIPILIYFTLRFNKCGNIGIKDKMKTLLAGKRNFNSLITYNEWRSRNEK